MSCDAVFTYVDGRDSNWQREYVAARCAVGARDCTVSDIRCMDHGELVLAVRLLLRHCTWVRHVYVVTAGARLSSETSAALADVINKRRLYVVPQASLLPAAHPPCFSSCTVEAYLHRIPGISPVFLYSNDDMMIGRPMSLAQFFRSGLPIVDVSLDASCTPNNMADVHCDNARRLFDEAFTSNKLPACRVAHVPALMCVAGCEAAWRHHGAALDAVCRVPIRTDAAVNFQLLAALHAVQAGAAVLRGATHVRRHLAWAFVESEPAGFAHLLAQMPHRFCVNGVDQASQARFNRFAAAYVAQARAGAYPRITRWRYASSARNDDRDAVRRILA